MNSLSQTSLSLHRSYLKRACLGIMQPVLLKFVAILGTLFFSTGTPLLNHQWVIHTSCGIAKDNFKVVAASA